MKTLKEKMSTEDGRIQVNFWAGFALGAWLMLILSLFSCSDDVNQCEELEKLCNNLRSKIEQTQNPDEKERYQEVYLAAQQELNDCRK